MNVTSALSRTGTPKNPNSNDFLLQDDLSQSALQMPINLKRKASEGDNMQVGHRVSEANPSMICLHVHSIVMNCPRAIASHVNLTPVLIILFAKQKAPNSSWLRNNVKTPQLPYNPEVIPPMQPYSCIQGSPEPRTAACK